MRMRKGIINIVSYGALLIAAFLCGRAFETGRKEEPSSVRSSVMQLPLEAAPPSYRQLAVSEIWELPFAQFYEALRSAPREAREKWANQLAMIPDGPRRQAAVAGFYKLLVQFDAVAAAKSAIAISDHSLQELALDSVTGAAPGSCLPELAKCLLQVPPDPSDYRKWLTDVLSEWAAIDPEAAAKFCDAHPAEVENIGYNALIKNWAALDPEAADKWIDAHHLGADIADAFVAGWYLKNREAAVAYVLQHAQELAPFATDAQVFASLYRDSKQDAKKFIEQLPNEEARRHAFRGLEFVVQFGTAEETGEADSTPRAVADWMVQFPPEYWRGHMAHVLDHWSEGWPQKIFSWVERQPVEIRNEIANEFQRPVSMPTIETVTAISNHAAPDLRERLLRAMFQHAGSGQWQMEEEITKSSLTTGRKNTCSPSPTKLKPPANGSRPRSNRERQLKTKQIAAARSDHRR